MLGWRAGLDAQTHQKLSDEIRGHFTTFLKDRPAATIGFYWPIQNEIDLRPVVTAHVKSGGKAALPVVPGKDQAMIFMVGKLAKEGAAPVWTTAGPATTTIFFPSFFAL